MRTDDDSAPGAWVPLRFRDLDAFGHVYHAEYLTLFDEARTRWFADVGVDRPGDYVVARAEVDWVDSLGPDDAAVRVDVVVEALGRTSVTLAETMHARDGRVVARCRSVTVRWDPSAARSRALTAEERRSLSGWSAPAD